MMVVGDGSLNPTAISLFTAIWTAGMAAMMFPAISPMVLLYNRLISKKDNNQEATTTVFDENRNDRSSKSYPLKTILFIGCYLIVWALTGIALLVGWTLVMNNISSMQNMDIIYGAILIISGAYQFSPLKNKCLGYCESPMSFFMRRWKDGKTGAIKMGLYHGMYCLGCCWPYFLLMVALGWMNLLWMGLFAAIIFGEKMWSRGIWIARAAGVGLAIAGILMLVGYAGTTTTPMQM
jgi:predicted metal-binding membrane protein